MQAQQKTIHKNMLWEGYYNTLHFDKKWSLTSDAQMRTSDWTKKWSQLVVRSGLNYAINAHFNLTGGFAFFKNAQYEGTTLLFKNEWRPYQELAYQVKTNKATFTQRLRTEQRFLQQVVNEKKTKRYEFVFRLRYRFSWLLPLKNDGLKLLMGNEVLVNPQYISSKRFFDQNRTVAGLHIKLNQSVFLECQYLKIFQWHSNTSVLDDLNVFRININHSIHFQKKSY